MNKYFPASTDLTDEKRIILFKVFIGAFLAILVATALCLFPAKAQTHDETWIENFVLNLVLNLALPPNSIPQSSPIRFLYGFSMVSQPVAFV
jgi:hypothetical protein